MERKYQITIYSKTTNKPVSCIIKRESADNLLDNPIAKKQIINDGIKLICARKWWNKNDLVRLGYSTVKTRICEN